MLHGMSLMAAKDVASTAGASLARSSPFRMRQNVTGVLASAPAAIDPAKRLAL